MQEQTTIPDDVQEEPDILFGVINRFIGYFTRQAVPNTTNDTTSEYPFVAMDTRQAYAQLLLARKVIEEQGSSISNPRFLDIGCGIGNILLLAEMMGFAIHGIEKDRGSLEIARQLVGPECVGEEDIWNYQSFADFDVVYYFRPFCEKEKQLAFESLIENSIKLGGLLIANRKMGEAIDQDPRFLRLDSSMPVWRRV